MHHAQVQEQLDATLRARQLAPMIFYGQHGGGGLLAQTDSSLKAELQALLPLDVWERARDAAKLRAAGARDAL